ncbi:MAG: hypothetical protein JWL96_1695 [Sphingomonas bacterium]|nr:hypothetical protein [Sphingomonas bacterium]
MALVNDQGGVVDDIAIRRHLPRQPVERVCLGLDLVPAYMTVDDGDIHAAGAMRDPELVEDERVGATSGMAQQLAMRCRSYVAVF